MSGRTLGHGPGRDAPVTVTAGLEVPAGTRLATDVIRPDGPGRHPALVLRTPYSKARHLAEARGWARRGFAVVVQDVRGRYESAGAWEPYRHEAGDGAVTVEWARAQPWCDGRVVAYGASYAAHCAIQTALATRVDAALVLVPAVGLAETARETTGVPRLASRAGWWTTYGDCRTERPGWYEARLADDPALLRHLPVLDLPARLGVPLPSWPRLWAARPQPDLAARLAALHTPLLSVGGLYDPFLDWSIRLWRWWGGPGTPVRLLLGPWTHDLVSSQRGAGERPRRPAHRVRLADLMVAWTRAALAGRLTPGPSAAVAVEAADGWLRLTSWPPGEEVPLPLDGRPGDLGFALAPGGDPETAHAFVADPEDPFPSVEGLVDVGPPRADCCRYESEALGEPVVLAGRPAAELRAYSDAPDNDWVARLSEVGRDGRAIQLAVGVTRGSGAGWRRVRVELGDVCVRLAAGARLRLEIAGHHFPAHARNPQTGADPLTATELRPARRRIDPERSALVLPVLAEPRCLPPDRLLEVIAQ
ncbi:putative S15-family peptidase [Carbonactinospora thermoautotrophica]|uniref:Putative S15-family peptidase n=2 Tax=Carbonactinospora thermoautotrophica TaxID=1469144 RepID=A0A132MTD7_9ACTN|nr:CocE/NonD family hydrolase [Carbonactinospora thermoautotrophica]KWX01006.1 putative S15-family peptidase [Carbonactinospora thermoautotrophica]